MSWLDDLTVTARVGDLFAAEVDALACPLHVDFKPYGSLARPLAMRYGEQALLEELRRVQGATPNRRLAIGQAFAIPAGGLAHAKHVIMVAYWTDDSSYTTNLVHRAYVAVLRQAFALRALRLALPLFGGNAWRRRFPEFCREVVGVLHSLDALRQSDRFPVTEIQFVSIHEEEVAELRRQLEAEL